MDPFQQLIYSQRPDVQGHPANDWWQLWGANELRNRLAQLGRVDVLQHVGGDNNLLRDWYTLWGSQEYPNIWNEQPKQQQGLDTQYAAGGVESAPSIPQFENVLPWEKVQQQWLPSMTAVGQQYALPEVQRQLNKDMQEYMMGMASAGGGRFGSAWGGTGALQSAAQRQGTEMTQDYITGQMNALKGLWYDPTRSEYQRPREPGMSDYGAKVSRSGYDVSTASDANLVMSSAFKTLKLVKIVDMTGETTVAHGLGFIPTFIFLRATKAGEWRMNNPGYSEGMLSTIYVDDTNVYRLTTGVSVGAYVMLFTDRLDE